jgi:putative transposase
MSERWFGRAPGGVCSLGLHLVWCAKCWRRILGWRIAGGLAELLERIGDEHGWQIVAKGSHARSGARVGRHRPDRRASGGGVGVQRMQRASAAPRVSAPGQPRQGVVVAVVFRRIVGYVLESPVRRCIEHQWDAVMVS